MFVINNSLYQSNFTVVSAPGKRKQFKFLLTIFYTNTDFYGLESSEIFVITKLATESKQEKHDIPFDAVASLTNFV